MFTPTITDFLVQFNLTPGVVNGSSGLIKFKDQVTFESIQNYQEFKGSYSPANDILNLTSGLDPSKAPNFILVSTSGQLNLTMQLTSPSGYITNNLPVFKVGMFLFPQDATASLQISNFYIDGRSNVPPVTFDPYPMPQGVDVDYWIILGQATLS